MVPPTLLVGPRSAITADVSPSVANSPFGREECETLIAAATRPSEFDRASEPVRAVPRGGWQGRYAVPGICERVSPEAKYPTDRHPNRAGRARSY
jgi:hypothetical protein